MELKTEMIISTLCSNLQLKYMTFSYIVLLYYTTIRLFQVQTDKSIIIISSGFFESKHVREKKTLKKVNYLFHSSSSYAYYYVVKIMLLLLLLLLAKIVHNSHVDEIFFFESFLW